MNHASNKINPEEVLQTISKTTRELNEGIQPGKLSKKAKDNILNELDNLEIKAHQLKLKIELSELKQLHPHLEIRDVLIKILPSMPNGISPKVLSALVDYLTAQWQILSEEVSA